MTTEVDIERVLDHWFEEGPGHVADRVVDEALGIVARTDQDRRWRRSLPWAGRHMTVRFALAVVLILLVAAVGVAAVAGILRDLSVVVPTQTVVAPTVVTPSAAPNRSAPAVARTSPRADRASLAPRPSGATLLLNGNPMTAGQTYTTLSFEPAFTIGGAVGWLIPLPAPRSGRMEGPAHAYLFGEQPTTGDPSVIPSLAIIRPSEVITEGGAAVEPAPPDFVAWLQARSDLSLGKPFQVRIGDLTGFAVEGTVRKGAVGNSVGWINLICSTDNVPCGWDNGQEVGVGPGKRFRFVVVDVRGQTVLIELNDNERSWSADLPTLEGFLDSLHFPGPNG